ITNRFVGPELTRYLRGAKKHLKSLTLRNAVADTGCLGDEVVPWHEFFDALADANLGLEEFVLETPAPLTDDEEFQASSTGNRPTQEPDEVKEVRRVLADEGSGRRLFGYSYMDDKYGNW